VSRSVSSFDTLVAPSGRDVQESDSHMQHRFPIATAVLAAAVLPTVTPASAGMDDGPQMGGPMQMYMIEVNRDMQSIMAMPMGSFGTVELQSYGVDYTGAASALNGLSYNAQWGWNAGGFIDLQEGEHFWIELVSATGPEGLSVFSGGTMMNPGTFDPIFGTDGSSSRIEWNGQMLHNWYAGDVAGFWSHDYRLYIGDADGNALDGWSDASATFTFQNVPAPGAAAVLALGGLAGRRRRNG